MARERSFDTDTAIDQALQQFWQKGYEGTSISDLTDALGINRPSLYSAFGSKEGLFRKALERYVNRQGVHLLAALEQPTARAAVEQLLQFHADAAGSSGRPHGCLLVQGALSCSEENQPIREELAQQRRAGELALTERLKRAKAEGDLPADESPADLSRYVWAVCQGLDVQANAGLTRAEARRIVVRAMRAWPEARG